MMLQREQVEKFQRNILDWYSKNKRQLPWRLTRDPYKILISEIMLQQTQVSRVIPKYEAWLHIFPTTEVLAKANVAEVLRLWSGLGYNRRVLYLQKAAKTIVNDYKGIWPQTVDELKKLPGIGEYTARAVACFAFDQQVAVVDTNVKKIIFTQFQISNVKYQMLSNKKIQEIADQLLPAERAYDWNQALMDYASSVLAKEKIVVPKQSRFQGSTRYYRGKLVKLLLQREYIEESKIQSLLHDEHMPETMNLQNILQNLEKEGFIKREKGIVELVK